MKTRVLALFLALCLGGGLAGCAKTPAEIALVTDASGVEDKSFNQGAWEGIWLYANVNGKTCNYYTPARQTDEAYLSSIDAAIKNGASVVIVPGDLLAAAAGIAQTRHPNTSFVALDAAPEGGPAKNTAAVTFAEEQAGYLAGYAAVRDGYTKLGFLGGMPVPGVVRYGFGFVQGIQAAAAETGAQAELVYSYVDSFEPNTAAENLAAGWYAAGTEVIFACGGAMNQSVFNAAEAAGGKTIGVDIDQSAASPTVITSATKSLGAAAGRMLELYYAGGFPGGRTLVLGVEDSSVGLAMESARFSHFTMNEYQAQLELMVKGDTAVYRETDAEAISPLDLPVATGRVEIDYQY